jgi:glycosyltransferase involved in cell wall biosynthesis
MHMIEKIPTVSVIIPTYNRSQIIGRPIQSVLNQTYRDFEMIVVDDGSEDNTEEVVKGFPDERIRYIKHDKNKGGGSARNTGIKAARGKYIAFQDSDDEWLPVKLEKQLKSFKTSPQTTGVVYTDMLRISEDGKTKYWHSPTITDGRLIDPKTSDYQTFNLGIQSTLIKKECFDITGLFDENLPRLIDLDLFIRLSRHYCFKHVKEPLVKYYATEGISTNTNALVTAQNLLLNKYFDEIKDNRRFLAKWYFRLGNDLCKDKQIERGRNYLFKAVRKYPVNIKYLGVALASLMGQKTYNSYAASYKKIRGLSVFGTVKDRGNWGCIKCHYTA